MQQKAVEEFHRIECHGPESMTVLVILPPERDVTILHGHKALIRDRDTISIPREIPQNVLGLAQGLLRIDHPYGTPERPQEALPGLRSSQSLAATRQRQGALARGLFEGIQEESSEAPTQDLHREEEVWATREPLGPVGC
jgi:hypothetical protein